jgi:hypothetical protein
VKVVRPRPADLYAPTGSGRSPRELVGTGRTSVTPENIALARTHARGLILRPRLGPNLPLFHPRYGARGRTQQETVVWVVGAGRHHELPDSQHHQKPAPSGRNRVVMALAVASENVIVAPFQCRGTSPVFPLRCLRTISVAADGSALSSYR